MATTLVKISSGSRGQRPALMESSSRATRWQGLHWVQHSAAVVVIACLFLAVDEGVSTDPPGNGNAISCRSNGECLGSRQSCSIAGAPCSFECHGPQACAAAVLDLNDAGDTTVACKGARSCAGASLNCARTNSRINVDCRGAEVRS